MSQPLLQIKNLKTRFKTDEGTALAVNGVDLALDKDETLGLVGESGCGKSVTALSIMRLIPDPPGRIVDGEILFQDRDLLRLSESRMGTLRGAKIAMIFQEPMTSLNPVFRVGDQVAEIIKIHRRVSKTEAREQAQAMLARVGIADSSRRMREYPHQMSGGMRQRIMIAMALVSRPALLIADEPTTALDVTIQAQILDLMQELKAELGTAQLLITHDLGVIRAAAQRAAVMYTGRIVELAGVEDLFQEPLHPYTLGLMASQPRIDTPVPADRRLSTLAGIVPSLFNLPAGCDFQNRCPRVITRCSKQRPELIMAGSGRWVRCWHYA